MLRPLNRFSTAFSALLVTACFNPDAPGSDTDDGTSGSGDSSATGSGDSVGSSGPTGAATGSEATSQTGTDSSGGVDLPPEVTAFTVNGSDSPAEIAVSGMVTLDADANDDVGIDRVEFYDGEQLVAVAAQSPYRAEVLLSSADNGSHLMWARAVDSAEQEGLSDEIEFSVSVLGGEMLEIREDIGTTLFFLPSAPRVAVDGDRVRLAALGDGLALDYRSFDLGLSLVQHTPPPDSTDSSDANSTSRPQRTVSGTHVLIGGAVRGPDDQWNSAIFRVDDDTANVERLIFGPAHSPAQAPLGISADGTVSFFLNNAVVAKYTADLATQLWTAEAGSESSGPLALAISPDDDVVVVYSGAGCGAETGSCVRKIRSNGDIEWTRTMPSLHLSVAISDNGEIAIPNNATEESTSIDLLAPNGDRIRTIDLRSTPYRRTLEVLFDPQGNLLVVGALTEVVGDNDVAWAMRLGPDGTVIWERTYHFTPSSMATSITVDPSGRVYMAGLGEVIDPGLLSFTAPLFIAELAL